MGDFDHVDIRILAELQRDSSRAIGDIADAVNLSQNACWRRIKRLEGTGVIRKRVALLDGAMLDAGLVAFVSVRAAQHTDEWLNIFATAIEAIPEVVEFHRMNGRIDYLLKVVVGDVASYDRVYRKIIKSAPLVDVSSSFAIETIKTTTELPLPMPGAGVLKRADARA